MNTRKMITLWAAATGMLILIFDGQTAMRGISCGIESCIRTLIPSLLPFFVLTGIITSNLSGQRIPFLRRIGKICHIPDGGESFLAMGLLAGYPVGAGNLYNAKRRGYISDEDANRMVVFCNNAGPSFIFGILGPIFPGIKWAFSLWLIQALSAVFTGWVLPGVPDTVRLQNHTGKITDIVNQSVRNMVSVCSWVILFRMIVEFLNKWVLQILPKPLKILMTGMLELSNGCLALDENSEPEIRFILASIMLSFGGISILMQTKAVFPDLLMKQYLAGRLIHLTFATSLSFMLLALISHNLHLCLIFLLMILSIFGILRFHAIKRKKEVAIP